MAVRKVFLSLTEYPYVKEISVTFPWLNGAKQQNVQAVLDAFHDVYPDVPALEVSLASSQPEGIGAAAMKLPFCLKTQQDVPVGMVYEASKVFADGGPYPELLQLPSQKRGKNRPQPKDGKCIGYRLEETDYPVQPYPYAFFNWLYGCTLRRNPEQAGGVLKFGAFSDLDLGSSKKDRNSPARAAAVYAGLAAAGKLDCYESFEAFVRQTCVEPLPEPQETPEPAEPVSVPEPEAETPQAAEKVPEKTPENNTAESAPQEVQTVLQELQQEPEGAPEPAESQPEAEPEPQPVVDSVELPTVGQMQEISYAPKVKNLLISLAKNAGCSAKTAAGVAQIGRELLLESYRKALEEGTITVNPEKNKVTFPLENPETDFHTVGQLTRCPVFVHGWKLNYQSLEPAAEKEPPKPPTAEEYLLSHGYTITQQVRENELPPAAVQKLAWETGEAMRDTTAAAFLQFIRTHLQFYDSFTFRMPKDAPAESRELTVALAQSWDHLGLFSELSANPSRIVCTLASENDVVRNFVSGHWLELYVVHCVQRVLNRWQEQGAEVSLCSNVILSDSPENAFAHELDVAFSVNGRFFWVEAKSSSRNINYGKYADLCTKLQVTPDQLLLVNSDLSEEDCRGVAYFWPYRVANCATMEQKLEEMIAAGQDA